MSPEEASEILADLGFTGEQIAGLMEVFAMHGHSHEIEDIEGLDEELAVLEEPELEEES